MRKAIIIIFLILITFSNISYAVFNEQAFNNAITAIDEWLNSVPEKKYQEASSKDVFQWKVEIENCGYDNYKKFVAYDDILSEIENDQFTYQEFVFHKVSLKYYQISKYATYFTDYSQNNSGAEVPIKPDDYLKSIYNFYKENINTKVEQWSWLYNLLDMVSYNVYGSEDAFIYSLRNNEYETVIEILKQYLALSNYIYNNNKSAIVNIDYVYSDTGIWLSTQDKVQTLLSPIYNFGEAWGKYLSEEDKDIILNFLLPQFETHDMSIKIYSVLNKTE